MNDQAKILEELNNTKVELYTTYIEHFIALTEISAPEAVFEMLDNEYNLVMDKLNKTIRHSEAIYNAR